MKIKKITKLLREGAEADIWYDAAACGDKKTAKYIAKVQKAMRLANFIIQHERRQTLLNSGPRPVYFDCTTKDLGDLMVPMPSPLERDDVDSDTPQQRFITFTTYDNEDPQAMTEAEFNVARFAADADWADYVWQFAESKAQAIAQHGAKLDEYQADVNAGRAEKHTY